MPATASTLSTTIQRSRDLARRAGLAGFWSWWGRELWSWVPSPVRDAVARRATRPVLAFDDAVATLWQPAAGGALRMVETARIALDADAVAVGAEGRGAIGSIARGSMSRPRVVVAIPSRSALRKMLTLPDALEEHLRQALAYDLDRHTPFQAADLYFDAVVTGRDAARRTIEVELVAARRNLVDPLIARAEEFGAEVAAVTVDAPERAAWSKVDLLPDERRASRHPWARWQVLVPALVLAALALTALILPVWQKRGEAIALIRVAEAARHRAEATDALRSDLERKVAEYNFPLARKYAFPGTVQLVNDVTHILPDDTWLTQFEYHAGRGKDTTHTVALRGESANAGKLVALLQDSKLFTQAAPRSPITKIQPGPGEIFDIGAQVEPYAAPKPASIDLSAPPPVLPRPIVVPRPAAPTPPAVAPAQPTAPSAAPPAAPAGAQSGAPAAMQPTAPTSAPAPVQPPAQPQSSAQPQGPPPAQPQAPVAAPAPSGFGPFPSTAVPHPRGSGRQP
ncbi:MAG TPA: pilus assembly protein PilM [Casimicrobiaceae bacterium]